MVKLSVIVPIYNEEKRADSLKKIAQYFSQQSRIKTEIIAVNDGSTDRTLRELQKVKGIRIITYSKNKGKGYAVKQGVLNAKGDFFLMTDIDLSTPPEEFEKLFKYSKNYDIIIGSRVIKGAKVKGKAVRKILGAAANLLINIFLLNDIKDTQCGFKLFNKKARILFEKQKINRWGYDFEILFLAKKFGLKIKEVPVTWEHREHSKIRLMDYPRTLLELIKIKLNDYRGDYD